MLAEAPAPVGEQRDLVGQRHRGRVDLERAGPADVAVGRFGCQLHAAAARLARDPGHVAGLAHQVGRLLRPHVDRGGETDRAVDHDAHAHAEFRVVGRGLGVGVAQADGLAADALDPQLGGLTTGRRVERGISQGGQLVGGQRHQATGVGWRTGSPAAV